MKASRAKLVLDAAGYDLLPIECRPSKQLDGARFRNRHIPGNRYDLLSKVAINNKLSALLLKFHTSIERPSWACQRAQGKTCHGGPRGFGHSETNSGPVQGFCIDSVNYWEARHREY